MLLMGNRQEKLGTVLHWVCFLITDVIWLLPSW